MKLHRAMNQAMADIPVVFFTLEMSAEQLTQRMLSNLATMDIVIRGGVLTVDVS